MSTPQITRISGGVAGIVARYDAMRGLADSLRATGERLSGHAAADVRTMAQPSLLLSAPLSPLTFATVETSVLAAASGRHGALEAAVACLADGLAVLAVVAAYDECDRLVAESWRALDYAVGRAAGEALAAASPALLGVGLLAAPTWHKLPSRTRSAIEHRLEASAEAWSERHPSAVQHAVDGGGGVLDGLLAAAPGIAQAAGVGSFHPTVAAAAGDLATLYSAERAPHVRPRPDLTVALGARPPQTLAGLVRHLRQTSALSLPARPDDQGTIEVQTFHARDGTARHVVYLPGTDDPTTAPWSRDGDVRDLPADLRVLAGEPAAYAGGIEQAMRRSGIGRSDPVLLVGHSLGGMEAADLLAHGSGFHVTHVVTAGSPIGTVRHFPAGTHVLSLENDGDVVPLLDGTDNDDSVQHVTVAFDDHERSILGNHRLRHYVAGAEAVDGSTAPSVREQLVSLRSAGFLGARGAATSRIFQITR